MPVVIVPEVVWLTPLRLVDHAPWTTQPDGGPDLLVGDLMEPSDEAEAGVSIALRESTVFESSVPRIEPRALRPYQEDCILAVFRAWASGKKAPLIVLATAAGKTVIAADIMRRLRIEHPGYDYRIWFLAHREELLDQTYRLVKLVAPEATCGIVQGDRNDVGKFVTVGSVDTLAGQRRFDEAATGRNPNVASLVARPPSLVIVDECFPAGTMIGTQPIQTVGVGDHVPSYDEATGRVVMRPVTRVMVHAGPARMVRIAAGSRNVVCTPEHPVLTRRGWLGAHELRVGDDVLVGGGSRAPVSIMRDRAASNADGGALQRVQGKESSCTARGDVLDGGLRRVPRADQADRQEGGRGALQGVGILFAGVRSRGDDTQLFQNDGGYESEVRLRTNEGAQPHASRSKPPEGECDATGNRPRTECSRGERSRADGGGAGAVCGAGPRLDYAMHRSDQDGALVGVSDALQARSGERSSDGSDRGGRVLPRSADTSGTGRQEDRVPTWTRVDCVEVHERRGDGEPDELCPDGRVYNLEVAETHTYIANGIVVHNCHHATSPKYRRVLDWIRAANPNCLFLGMTATPGRTDGTALDSVFDCVAYERNAFQLIEEGYLVPPVGYRVELNINLDVIPTEDGEFKKAPLSKVMNQPAINQAVVEGYLRYGDSRKLLAFCVTVQHAKDLAEQFRMMGIPARHIDGGMKTKDRDAVKLAFAEGKIRILTSCDVITEGYDDPSAQGALFCRPTNSQLVYIQALGRALRLHPSKRDALVIDCVGNSQRHQLAQLASLAGLSDIAKGDGRTMPPGEDVPLADAEVGGLNAHRIDFRVLRRPSKWSWRETRFGWTVSIPRIGYFLLAWMSNDRRTVDVKFHDMRDGKRAEAPLVLSTMMDFEMAHGLVEQEIERLFMARTSKARIKDSDGGVLGAARDVLDEGIAGELFSPEELMRNDADWRSNPTTEKQRAALIDIGVKPESVPGTAGEASDLFSVMTIEKNAKQREPATPKQKAMIVQQRLATYDEAQAMTKKQANGLIIRFLKEKEAKKAARKSAEVPEDDDAPPFTDEDAPP